MRPSEVRQRILSEHEEIRGLLSELECASVEAVRGGGAPRMDILIAARRALYEKLRQHIDLEDAILGPALRELDAWGHERAEALARHHQEQRRWLGSLLLAVEEPPPSAVELAHFVRWIGEVLRDDMAQEERDLLNPDLLRDDVVAIDVQTG